MKAFIHIVFLALVALLTCWKAEGQIYNTNNNTVQTYAGTGAAGYLDTNASSAMFDNPVFILADSKSNLFIWDDQNARIRKITPDGIVSTFAGGGNLTSGYGTNVSLSSFVESSYEIAIDHNDIIYLTTVGGLLTRIRPDAYVSPVTNFTFGIEGICVDSHDNIYLADQMDNKIYRYQTNGTLSVFAGSGSRGALDGNGTSATFIYPQVLACDAFDNIYVSDAGNALLRRIDPNQNVVTISGIGGANVDGVGTNATFSFISAMCVDSFNNLIVACGPNNASFPITCIRMVDAKNNVTTLAGSFTQWGYTNGPGYLARFGNGGGANIDNGGGVCISQGKLFIADYDSQRIRELPYYSQSYSAASLQLNIYPVLTITGTLGATYQIQVSTDMVNWTNVASVFLNTTPYQWIDQKNVIGSRYYRAVLLF